MTHASREHHVGCCRPREDTRVYIGTKTKKETLSLLIHFLFFPFAFREKKMTSLCNNCRNFVGRRSDVYQRLLARVPAYTVDEACQALGLNDQRYKCCKQLIQNTLDHHGVAMAYSTAAKRDVYDQALAAPHSACASCRQPMPLTTRTLCSACDSIKTR